MLDEALALAAKTETLQRLAPVRAARAEAAWLAGDSRARRRGSGAACDLALQRRHGWFAGELIFGAVSAANASPRRPGARRRSCCRCRATGGVPRRPGRQLGCPYEQARALADGDTAAQIEALEIFTRLGAAPAAALLRQRLRGAGIRHIPRGPRPTTRSNPFGLTVREIEILDCLPTA